MFSNRKKSIMANMSRRNFILSLGTLAGTVALAGCGNSGSKPADSGSDAKKSDYTLVADGKLTVAFDLDLIKADAQKMGLEASYLPNQKFDTLVPLVKQGGKADVAIAAITITDERLESVDFTNAYLDSNQAIVVKKDSADTADTLNDASKQVVCQSGTTGNEWITENLPKATCVPVDDVTAALTGVQTGLYAAMVVDLPVASYMLTQSFSDLQVIKEIPTGEQYGIAVSKDQPALTEALNKALADLDSDGTMKDIKTKWFGSEI